MLNTRFWLAGPFAIIISIFVMAAMSLWFPIGIAGINHLVLPLILFPLIWAGVFFYALLEKNIKRATLVMTFLFLLNALPVITSILGLL